MYKILKKKGKKAFQRAVIPLDNAFLCVLYFKGGSVNNLGVTGKEFGHLMSWLNLSQKYSLSWV